MRPVVLPSNPVLIKTFLWPRRLCVCVGTLLELAPNPVRVPQESNCYAGTVVLLSLLLLCSCMHGYMCVSACVGSVSREPGTWLTLEGPDDGIATEIDSDHRSPTPPPRGEGIKCVLVAFLRSHCTSSTNHHHGSVEPRWPASKPSPSLSRISALSSSSFLPLLLLLMLLLCEAAPVPGRHCVKQLKTCVWRDLILF